MSPASTTTKAAPTTTGTPRPAGRPGARRAPRLPARASATALTRTAPTGSGRRPRGRAATVLLCGAMILGALLLALWLNISLTRGSYAAGDLAARATLLQEQEQALTEHLQEVSSPSALAASAEGLGMVPTPEDTWLVLQGTTPQEAVVGDPEAAPAPATPTPGTPTPDATPQEGD